MIRYAKITIFVLLFFSATSEAGSGVINLGPLGKTTGDKKIFQNAYVEISNSFSSVLYDITVTESPSEKRVLFIDDFQSGQSFEISFAKVGKYEICYSSEKRISSLRTCLKVDVIKAKLI